MVHLTNCSIWTLQITVVEPVPIQVNHRQTSTEQLCRNRRGGAQAQPQISDVETAGASPDLGQPQTTSRVQLRRNRRGGARAQPRTSDVQTAGASPDPGQPQRTSGEQLSDVDTDDSVNLQNSDESDQDDTGWGDSVSQFDVQFYDNAPYVRLPVDNRAKECDYFRLLFSNDIVENLVEQTNLYATQPKTKTVLCRGTSCPLKIGPLLQKLKSRLLLAYAS